MFKFVLVLLSSVAVTHIGFAQHNPLTSTNLVVPEDGFSGIIHVAGLSEIKPNAKGTIAFTPSSLVFSTETTRVSILRADISNALVGDQWTEVWGTTGAIMRKVIPFGGGAALGAATNKKVDLLTIEYRDQHEGYHGVVFVVPSEKAAVMRDQLTTNPTPLPLRLAPACTDGPTQPRSVLLLPIAVSGVGMPAEYRVLLYEQIYKQLSSKRPSITPQRSGDLSAGPGCSASVLKVGVTDFKKGNAALRGSTGPVGFFIGATSLTFDISLQDAHGKILFHQHMKKSKRDDSDSLGIADGIAKSITKRIDQELRTPDPQTPNRHDLHGTDLM